MLYHDFTFLSVTMKVVIKKKIFSLIMMQMHVSHTISVKRYHNKIILLSSPGVHSSTAFYLAVLKGKRRS